MNLLAWPVLVPLMAGAALLLVPSPRARSLLGAAASFVTLVVSAVIAARTLGGEVMVVQMGNWPAPYGITLVADGLSGGMLLLSAFAGLLTVRFAASSLQHAPTHGRGPELNRLREAFGTQALFQFLFMGVHMSFLTGDLFNLFVAFEVMLIASYGLLLIGGEFAQLIEGFKYVVINLLASAVFVLAAGLTYGLVGTLNMADVAVRLAEVGPDPRVTLVALLLGLVFATKAAVFPFGFWLPDSYPAPAAATSAFFAGVLTKVGVYALLRTFTLMFPDVPYVQPLLLGLAGVTMLVGGFGAIARQRWRPALAFANVASVGYLVMGAFADSRVALAGALFYLAHSVLVVFTLFLIAALAEKVGGARYRSPGHLALYPWLGVGFFVPAMALAGIPPTSGFVGKFALIGALLGQGGWLDTLVAASAVLTGFLLLYAAVQIWQGFFWGESDAVHTVPLPRPMTTVAAASVVAVVALAVASGPVFGVTRRVADRLATNDAYIEAVLAPKPTDRGPSAGGDDHGGPEAAEAAEVAGDEATPPAEGE